MLGKIFAMLFSPFVWHAQLSSLPVVRANGVMTFDILAHTGPYYSLDDCKQFIDDQFSQHETSWKTATGVCFRVNRKTEVIESTDYRADFLSSPSPVAGAVKNL
jgi:hypothetical protein